MQTLWFCLIAFMLTMYVLLDGFDLGAGAIHLFVARNNPERRTVIRAIGPVWDGNEVWLIAAGGALFCAFPLLYASGFSGFYLPLIMVLWLLMARAAAIELRSHLPNPVWASFWDGAFAFGSTLLAVFYGAAIANVVRGVPLNAQGYFFEALWTNWDPKSSNPGILDWYTVLIGLLALATLIVHGASYLAVKTSGDLNTRARAVIQRVWVAVVVLTVLSTVATFWIRSSMLTRFNENPYGYVLPLAALLGLVGIWYYNARGREVATFAASCAYIIGMLGSTVFGVYPNVLPAVHATDSLTIHNAAAANHSLSVMILWWPIALVLTVAYFVVLYRLFRGKIPLPA
jgi:cytochrome d ubiquinol oxidase subunit II